MKNQHLYVLSTNFDKELSILAYCKEKEVFINGDLIPFSEFIIYQGFGNLNDYISLPYKKISNLIKNNEPLTITEYMNKNYLKINIIKDFQLSKKIQLSWLDTIQLSFLINLDSSKIEIDNNLSILKNIQSKLKNEFSFIF